MPSASRFTTPVGIDLPFVQGRYDPCSVRLFGQGNATDLRTGRRKEGRLSMRLIASRVDFRNARPNLNLCSSGL